MERGKYTNDMFQSSLKYFMSFPINEVKKRCISLYNQIEKDEDGFVVFKDDNGENEYLYLTESAFNHVVVRKINAVKFSKEGNLLLCEEDRKKYFYIGAYEESEHEILSKLFVMLSNQ